MDETPFSDETAAETKTRAAAAIAGRLAVLSELAPEAAYRWLLVALDAGHEDAADRLANLKEHVDLFHFDEGGAQALVELDVALLYFRGDVVPLDLEKGRAHLGVYLDVAQSGLFMDWTPSSLSSLAAELPTASKAVIESTINELPFRAVTMRVERLRTFWKIGKSTPPIIIAHELGELRKAVEALDGFMGDR